MPDEIVQLTPDQQAQYQSATSSDTVQLTPDQQSQYRQQAGIVDPFHDFSPQQLVDLTVADPDHFDLVGKFSERPELHQDTAVTQKVADAYNLLKQRGVLADLPNGKQLLKTVWDTAKGFGNQVWNYAQAAAAPAGAAIAEAAGQPSDIPEQMLSEATRKIAENVAGTESAATGLGSMVKRGVGRISRGLGLSKSLDQYTPEEKLSDLFGAVGEIQQQGEIAKGHGEMLGAVGGHVIKELEQQGLPVRPEEVQQLASGDPFSWFAMGKAFQAGKAVPGFGKGVGRIEQTLEKTGEVVARVGGAAVTGAAKTAEVAAKGVEKVAVPVSAVAGAAAGAASHGPTGLLVGGAAGLKVGETIAGGAEKFGEAAKKAGEIGRQIAGIVPVASAYAQAGRDILQALPGAATEITKGGAFDLGLAATTAETPQEKAGVGIGTVFGLLGAGARLGGRFISGQIIGPREYGTQRVVPSSGQFPAFDTLHSTAMQEASPGVRARVNAVRSFVQGAAPGTDVFLAKDAPALEQALLSAGVSPDQAKSFSNTEGFFTTDLPGKDGQPRRVILARNIDSAPHEAFHAVQDVLGESANRQLDQFIQGQFDETQWNQLGESYARRLGGNGTWQENILDGSGWGNAEAAEKIHQDIFNKLSQATGAKPDEATVIDLAQRQWAQHVADAVKANPDQTPAQAQRMLWRNILSATEASDVANRYLSREVAAENFDALFKNTGPTLEGNKAIPARLARVVGRLTQLVGGEPLAGRASEIGGFPLKAGIVEAVKTAAQTGKPTIEPAKAPLAGGVAPKIPAGAAITPSDAATEARQAASTAPETPLVAGGTKSAREILGQIAEAIAQRTGLKINYLSAPDEPAAAISADRTTRRAMIETFRNLPAAARSLWEKTFFPERVLSRKGGKFQVLGWSPEVFAANAHRLAEFANKSGLKLPYELDPKTGSFSEAGWKQLFDDTQKFVANQTGGRTGAGEELVVPKSATGAFKPPVSGIAEALPQEKADVINALFGYKLPETPRITGNKLPLNIVGQEVSAATKPGRVVEPIRPRGEFTGEKAGKLGIEGRNILEVNPFRNQITEAARTAGVAEPSFIEAQQLLNLENIKELEGAPEQPQFRGNTLTLTAGFQPAATTTAFLDKLRDSTPEQWSAESRAFTGKFSGGQTGWSFEVGSQAKTPEDAAAFRSAAEQFKQMSKDAMASKDMALAMSLGSKAQAAREAFEAATGTHLDGSPGGADFIIKHKDPNYKPPIPPVAHSDLIGGQFQPSENPRAIRAAAVRDENGNVFEGTWHFGAFQRALDAGKNVDLGNWERGFTTNSGEFLTREQAADRARKVNQLDKGVSKDIEELHSGDVELPAYVAPRDVKAQAQPESEFSKLSPDDQREYYELRSEQIAKFFPEALKEDLEDSIGESLGHEGRHLDPIITTAFGDSHTSYWLSAVANWMRMYETAKLTPDDGAELSGFKVSYPDFSKGVEKIFSLDPHLEEKVKEIIEKPEPILRKEFFSSKLVPLGFENPKDIIDSWPAYRDEVAEKSPPLAVLMGVLYDETFTKQEKPKTLKEAAERLGNTVKLRSQAQPNAYTDEERSKISGAKPGITSEIGLPVSQEKRGVTEQVGLPPAQEKRSAIEAQPRKPEDWELKPASGGFSKAWITPGGVPIQLGGQWHHEYMVDHPELTKQFGLPAHFTAEDRFEALKKGFARLNYSANNGALTVEAAADSWRKLKPSIEKLFEANVDKIDNMTVELFNAKGNVVDSDSAQLFRYDDAEKMQNIPFVTGSQPKFQAQPQAFKSETFDKEIEDIRSGKSGGQTFTTEGDVWTPKAPTDIVTLASVNVPQGELTRDRVEEALKPYRALLEEPGIVAGLFAFSKDSKPTVSIDVNAAIPQKYRANTLQFAKANDQVAIWDAAKGENVETGGKGNTRLTSPGEILDAFMPLVRGKPVDIDEVQRQNAESKSAEEELTFPGVSGKRALASSEVAGMTKAELAAHYPEAVVPKQRDEPISSRIVDSPLAKTAGTPADAEEAFARKLVEFAKEWQDHPSYQDGLKWYSDFVPKLKKEFGVDAPVMAELLAATSPNTTPDINFGFAFDALEGLKSGRFKKQISKFDEGLEKIADDTWVPWYNREVKTGNVKNPPAEPTPAAFLARWIEKYDLIPRQSNGKLYGMHSVPVLRVFARQWLEKTSGLKTQNFVQNLMGTGHEATIDVWADRTMRRLGYSGFQDRWRILPKNGTAVTDPDFKFSQAAFNKAAGQLGIKPDALQGGLWFAEKQLWGDKGWGRLDLGDFRKEIQKIPMLRQGIEHRTKVVKAAGRAKEPKQLELSAPLIEPRPTK